MLNVNEVAIPKFPPPPPWLAQKRSPSSPPLDFVQCRSVPSAVMTSIDSSRSQVSPYERPTTPCPPPSARPLIPTVGHEPAGIATPAAASPAYTSTRRAPAPMVALPFAALTPAIRVTSMTSPVPVDQPP